MALFGRSSWAQQFPSRICSLTHNLKWLFFTAAFGPGMETQFGILEYGIVSDTI